MKTATKAAPVAPAMQQIELTTSRYSNARADLGTTLAALQDEIDQVKKKYMASIRKDVAKAKALQAELKALVEAHPEIFEKPRTVIFHGIKVGYRKGSGKVTFQLDEERVIALIRKHLPDQVDVLIEVSEKAKKKTIADLDGAELKKIGCAIEGTGDVVEIKPVDGEVDKIVAALLKDEPEEAA